MNDTTIFLCSNIGVAGTTDCHVRPTNDGKYEARMGVSLLGLTNMDDAGFKNCNYDPWHDEFYDNFAVGIGETKDDSVEALKKSMIDTAESLWAF